MRSESRISVDRLVIYGIISLIFVMTSLEEAEEGLRFYW
jgi:hypothetical protein